MSAKQLPKAQTGLPAVDRHLALLADTLNPLLRSSPLGSNSRQLLNAFTVAVPTDWVNLALLNSFTSGSYTPRIRKTGNGETVYVDGAVNVPAGPPGSNTPIATIPTAYAPDLIGGNDLLLVCMQQDTFNDMRLSATQIKNGFSSALVPGDFFTLNCSYTSKDRTPVVPSCFPVDVPYSLASPPSAVFIASCVDQANLSAPAAWPPLSVQWKATPGVQNSIRVLNIPGLLPTHTYSIQLLALA